MIMNILRTKLEFLNLFVYILSGKNIRGELKVDMIYILFVKKID